MEHLLEHFRFLLYPFLWLKNQGELQIDLMKNSMYWFGGITIVCMLGMFTGLPYALGWEPHPWWALVYSFCAAYFAAKMMFHMIILAGLIVGTWDAFKVLVFSWDIMKTPEKIENLAGKEFARIIPLLRFMALFQWIMIFNGFILSRFEPASAPLAVLFMLLGAIFITLALLSAKQPPPKVRKFANVLFGIVILALYGAVCYFCAPSDRFLIWEMENAWLVFSLWLILCWGLIQARGLLFAASITVWLVGIAILAFPQDAKNAYDYKRKADVTRAILHATGPEIREIRFPEGAPIYQDTLGTIKRFNGVLPIPGYTKAGWAPNGTKFILKDTGGVAKTATGSDLWRASMIDPATNEVFYPEVEFLIRPTDIKVVNPNLASGDDADHMLVAQTTEVKYNDMYEGYDPLATDKIRAHASRLRIAWQSAMPTPMPNWPTLVFPLPGKGDKVQTCSPFYDYRGYRGNGLGTRHIGTDYPGEKYGERVDSSIDGTVLEAYGDACGTKVIVAADNPLPDGRPLIIKYANLGQTFVVAEVKVRAGQAIGTLGRNDWVKRPCLHYEVWYGDEPVDCEPLIKRDFPGAYTSPYVLLADGLAKYISPPLVPYNKGPNGGVLFRVGVDRGVWTAPLLTDTNQILEVYVHAPAPAYLHITNDPLSDNHDVEFGPDGDGARHPLKDYFLAVPESKAYMGSVTVGINTLSHAVGWHTKIRAPEIGYPCLSPANEEVFNNRHGLPITLDRATDNYFSGGGREYIVEIIVWDADGSVNRTLESLRPKRATWPTAPPTYVVAVTTP